MVLYAAIHPCPSIQLAERINTASQHPASRRSLRPSASLANCVRSVSVAPAQFRLRLSATSRTGMAVGVTGSACVGVPLGGRGMWGW